MSAESPEVRLAAIPGKHAAPADATLAKLPKPLKRDAEKGKCDVCGGWHGLPAIHLDYMGHAEVTLALIEVDPLWTWEPLGIEDGAPIIRKEGNRLVMWGRLTVLGKSIIGVGTCEAGKGDPEKELIGDFFRNAAMRFGIGTKLWSKATDADPAVERSGGGYDGPKRGRASQEPELLEKRPGDLMAERVAEAIAADPTLLGPLKAADKDRRGFSGQALDDDEWRSTVGSIIKPVAA